MTAKPLPYVLALLALSSSYAFAMTNDDVVKLSKAGLEDKTIILAIQNTEENGFDTSTNAIIALTKQGIGSEVINAIIETGRNNAKSVTSAAKSTDESAGSTENQDKAIINKIDPSLIKAITDNGETDLMYTTAQIRTAARALGLGGVASYAVLRGSRSQCRLTSSTPEFIISVPNRAQVNAFMQLASFAVRKNNSREVLIGGGYMSYSTGIHPDRVMPIHTQKLEDQSNATDGFTLYKITMAKPLARGEYAIVYYSSEINAPSSLATTLYGSGNAYFDFGID